MQKLILISIIFVDVIVPLWAARDLNALRGMKKALVCVGIYNVIYLLLVMFVFPRLG